MSISATITPIVLDTVLGHLAPHFLISTNGDVPTARHAASRMLACHDAQTEEELHLAADIVTFGFHTLEALSHAASADMPLNQKLRLRGGAVSLSRERHKAQRKLDQLKRARLTRPAQSEITQEPPAPTPQLPAIPHLPAIQDQPGTGQALSLIEFAREAIQASTKKGGVQAFSLSRQQRRAAEQIAENFRRNKAELARRDTAAAAASIAVPPVDERSHQAAI
jgi:hypothetical protein